MSHSIEPEEPGTSASALYQQAVDDFDRGDLEQAEEHCRNAIAIYEETSDEEISKAYFRLGLIRYWQGDADAAERWYRESLRIDEKNGNELGIAEACHNLSVLANRDENFELAKKWLQRAIRIQEKLGDEERAATSYHQMGLVEYGCGHLDAAEHWYLKAIKVDESNENDLGAAITYHNMSAIARDRGDFDLAEEWLWKAIRIREKHNAELDSANSYNQLGTVANRREHFQLAEKWYTKALEIGEKHNDLTSMASNCFNLTWNARDQGNHEAAEDWLQKTLSLSEDSKSTDIAIRLGREAERSKEFKVAEKFYRKALEIAHSQEDKRSEARCHEWLAHLAYQNGDYQTSKKCYVEALAILEELGISDRAKMICISLGNLGLAKTDELGRDYGAAKKWFRRAIEFNEDAGWSDWITLTARLYRYRLKSLFSR